MIFFIEFLICSGYPECQFAFNLEIKDHPEIYRPDCGKSLEIRTIDE